MNSFFYTYYFIVEIIHSGFYYRCKINFQLKVEMSFYPSIYIIARIPLFIFILQSVLRQVRSLLILQSVLRQVRSLFILQSLLQVRSLFILQSVLRQVRSLFILQSVLQVRSLFQSEFSTGCDLVLPLSISSIFSFP
jgi:hypothetical protein